MCEYQYQEIEVADDVDNVPWILEVVGRTAVRTGQLIFQEFFFLR